MEIRASKEEITIYNLYCNKRHSYYRGPSAVGSHSPTKVVMIQMATATINAFSHPIR